MKLMNNDLNKRIVPGKGKLEAMELPAIKMKDKAGRDRVVLSMIHHFGFKPDILIIDKVPGENNTLKISAIVPEEASEKIRKSSKWVAQRAKEANR